METGTPYDCNSILHLPRELQSRSTGTFYSAITSKEPKKACLYDKQNTLSELDAIDVNVVYGCNKYLNN